MYGQRGLTGPSDRDVYGQRGLTGPSDRDVYGQRGLCSALLAAPTAGQEPATPRLQSRGQVGAGPSAVPGLSA